MATNQGQTSSPHTVLLTLITLLGFALRTVRIEWQPLWWDEGYSVFFATEPLGRMLALTSRDIHPPAYYAALHAWLALLSTTGPAALRLFSILAGTLAIPLVAALTYRLGNRRSAAAGFAALLLALNPLHIYYSQEIRMYSLAATVALASTYCLVNWVAVVRAGRRQVGWLVTYIALTLLLVHTLYYAAVLVAIQFLWAAWLLRGQRHALARLFAGVGVVLILSLPWLWYAGPRLSDYVGNKVQSDQDVSLALADYLARHVIAFSAGHVLPFQTQPLLVMAAGLLALMPLVFARRRESNADSSRSGFSFAESVAFLAFSVIGVLLFGFGVNVRYPFFPEGGERLLLFALPYLLALIALGVSDSRLPAYASTLLVSPLFVVFLFGVIGFYTQPRHVEQDYRAIVHVVEQRGSANDTVLAIFPWQVGYWRAYGQRDESGALYAPQPAPVGQEILEWNEAVSDRVDQALARGVLWFPEPLALGSTLPLEVEEYLRAHALNIEDKWQTEETRLTAWTTRQDAAVLTPAQTNFGHLTLAGYAISPQDMPSDNSVIDVALAWVQSADNTELQVALKLVDSKGGAWAERSYNSPGSLDRSAVTQESKTTDRLGLQVPAGLPPGAYDVILSVLNADNEPLLVSDAEGRIAEYVSLGSIDVTIPDTPADSVRVPIDRLVDTSGQQGDLHILGVSGLGAAPHALAGADLSLQVALQSLIDIPGRYDLALQLVDTRGRTHSEWQGWPLVDLPTQRWLKNTIIRVPVTLELPATTPAGAYRLIAALVDHDNGARLSDVELATVDVSSRPGEYEAPSMMSVLDAPVQFGTHANLLGYDILQTDADDERRTELVLYWQVLQPLRPQHHIFVHAVDDAGVTIAQQDGPPVTEQGPAPTGSWRTGEYIATRHAVSLPAEFVTNSVPEVILTVGLYNPESGVRLPTFVEGAAMGDSVALQLGSP